MRELLFRDEKKYIDAEKLVDFIDNNSAAIDDEYEKTYTLDDIQAYLNAIPAADVAEVRHGEWIGTDGDNGDYESGHSAWIEFHCSCCEYEMSLETGEYGWGYDDECKIPFSYCPDCGARMDGDAK